MVSQKVKGILSVVSGLLLQLMCGSKYVWSNINPYFASYLYYKGNKDIKTSDTYFLFPCCDMIIYLFLGIGVKIGSKIGVKYCVLISVIIHYISFPFLIFTSNYYLLLLSMGIFGFGVALSNMTYIKNAWKYFPEHHGLVNGIIVSGAGLFSSILTPIADYIIINPERQGTNSEGIYPEFIATRLKKFLYVIVGVNVILGTLAFLFSFEFKEDENSKESEQKLINENKEKIEEKKGIIHKAFFSLKNLQLLSFCFCGFFLNFLISNCNRDFANKNKLPQNVVFIIGILFGLVNGASRYLWGWLMDKYGFKILMIIMTIIEITAGSSLYFIVKIPVLYVIFVLLIASCIGGSFATLAPLFNKIFGIEIGTQVYGLTALSIGVANISGPLITKFTLKKITDYLIAFFVGVGLCIIKLTVLIFFKEKNKFNYEEKGALNEKIDAIRETTS